MKCKAVIIKKKEKKKISNGTLQKTADKINAHPGNPMSATKTEKNDGKNVSPLGCSTRT